MHSTLPPGHLAAQKFEIPKKIQVAANRTISTPVRLPMAHLKACSLSSAIFFLQFSLLELFLFPSKYNLLIWFYCKIFNNWAFWDLLQWFWHQNPQTLNCQKIEGFIAMFLTIFLVWFIAMYLVGFIVMFLKIYLVGFIVMFLTIYLVVKTNSRDLRHFGVKFWTHIFI